MEFLCLAMQRRGWNEAGRILRSGSGAQIALRHAGAPLLQRRGFAAGRLVWGVALLFQTFALPEAETALIWSLPTTLLFLIIYSLPKHRGLAYLAVFVLWGIAAFFVMREVVTGAVFVAEQFSTQASAVFPKLGHFAPPQAQEDLAACRMFSGWLNSR